MAEKESGCGCGCIAIKPTTPKSAKDKKKTKASK